MQLMSSTNNVQSTFGEGQRLQIAATATAMKVLSKNLYSNPILAVLREVGTNAADAHISAGIGEKPFEVYLPTYQNQVLRIRDYGSGIHPDKVIDIFATYFSSTKTEDNTVTGCLGLGSKSPLAISDQFTVEIWFEGYYYVWSIYKDEEGFPCVPNGRPSLIEPTVEPTGVQITIPVSDHRNFEETAKALYCHFSPIPNVWKGSNKVDIKRPESVDSYPSCTFEDGEGCYALMGNICYPINSSISGLEGYRNLGSNNKVIIPFEIGQLEFAASREALEYNKKVLHTLKQKYKDIIAEFQVEVQKKIDKEKNPFDAVCLFNSLSIPYNLKNEIRNTVTYNGNLLKSYYRSFDTTNYDMSIMKTLKPHPYFTCEESPLYVIESGRRKFYKYNCGSVSKSSVFYYNDEGKTKGVVGRLHALWQKTYGKTFYLLTDDVDIDKWLALNHLTKDCLVGTSTVPKISVTNNYESRKRAGLFSIEGGETQKDFWKSLDKVPDFGYYFVKSGDKIVVGGQEYFPRDWDGLVSLGIFPTDADIFGISKSFVKDYEDWTKMDDLMIPALEARRDELELALANRSSDIFKLVEYWPKGEFKSKLINMKKNIDKLNHWEEMYRMFNIPLDGKSTLRIDVEEIMKKYPMLRPLTGYYNTPDKKDVADYITSIGDIV